MKRYYAIGLLILLLTAGCNNTQENENPNVLWIYVDDMSGWLSCYGDTVIQTPNIDGLAKGGVRFDRAYMPAPVCSPTRSGLITGTMPTTFGIHQHRTRVKSELPEGVKTIPELFRENGYVTFNVKKSDYNFDYDQDVLYSPEFVQPAKSVAKSHLAKNDLSWLKQLAGKKFFGQIQLAGGKWGGEVGQDYPVETQTDQKQMVVPPQYPDNPVIKSAMAYHYDQILTCDDQVGAIIKALKEYDIWDNTAVFFFSDHGSPMPRAKQYLYEEGTRVPLIVHWPEGGQTIQEKGDVRKDLVSGIDISTSSLGVAGITIPEYMEGKDLFSESYEGRPYVISVKDRMGNAIDRGRAVYSEDYMYIKNYYQDRPLYQSAYRDSYATFIELRKLYAENELSPLQASYHDASQRPAEELYDLKQDPHQVNNLAGKDAYIAILEQHRAYLKKWIAETSDQGQVPPSEEELERVYNRAPNRCKNPEYDIFK
ncbi:MAG: sulfatase [Cyclobacteriaceae bacterium]